MNSVNEMLNTKRVLITGASGFVGMKLRRALREMELELLSLSRQKSNAGELYGREFILNLLDQEKVSEIVQQFSPHIVIHLAGSRNRSGKISDETQVIKENFLSYLNLVNASRQVPHFEKFISIGSIDEYGPVEAPFRETQACKPKNAYGYSKLMVTEHLHYLSTNDGLCSTVLRPSVLFGPGQKIDMFLPAIIDSLTRREVFQMTEGLQTRNFLHVDDLIDAILRAASRPVCDHCEIYNVAAEKSIKLRDLAKILEKNICGTEGKFVIYGAIPSPHNEIFDYRVDIQKIERDLHWQPTISIVDYLNSHYAY